MQAPQELAVNARIKPARMIWDRQGDAVAFSGSSTQWVIEERNATGGKLGAASRAQPVGGRSPCR